QALGAPFEAMLAPVARLDRGAAVAGEDVHDLLVKMLLRRGLGARGEVEHKDRDKVAAALEVRNRAVDAEARPARGRDRQEIDAEILGDQRAFLVAPGEIWVEQQLGMFRQRLVHGSLALLDSGGVLRHT